MILPRRLIARTGRHLLTMFLYPRGLAARWGGALAACVSVRSQVFFIRGRYREHRWLSAPSLTQPSGVGPR